MKRAATALGIILLSLTNIAFQWPWEVQGQDALKKKQPAQQKTQAKPGLFQQKPAPEARAASQPIAGSEKAASGGGGRAGTEGMQIQEKIADIIKVSDALKANSGAQARDIAVISEQAKIHQDLLSRLAPAPAPVQNYSRSDADEMIRQQKIRLTSEEASRSRNVMDTLRRNENVRT